MIKIILNGAETDLEDNASIEDLLVLLGFQGQRVAVEVNREVIPRGAHISFILSANDKVEIIHAVGGG